MVRAGLPALRKDPHSYLSRLPEAVLALCAENLESAPIASPHEDTFLVHTWHGCYVLTVKSH